MHTDPKVDGREAMDLDIKLSPIFNTLLGPGEQDQDLDPSCRGPNYLEGLRKVKAASDKLGLGIKAAGAALECQNLMTFWILSLKAFCS